MIGFGLSAVLFLAMKWTIKEPRLYKPPEGNDRPPEWIRGVLIATCGGISFAHGSNDGQKGVGLLMLVLIGFLPYHYALNGFERDGARRVSEATIRATDQLPDTPAGTIARADLAEVTADLEGKVNFTEVAEKDRWVVRTHILKAPKHSLLADAERNVLNSSVEYVPLWVVIGTALALGCGTMIGYKRIVVTDAEKIGTTHMTYAQGAAAEFVTALTVLLATLFKLPVSTTHVLSSGIAGTMVANGSGIQRSTARKTLLAWVLTLPCSMFLSGLLFAIGRSLL